MPCIEGLHPWKMSVRMGVPQQRPNIDGKAVQLEHLSVADPCPRRATISLNPIQLPFLVERFPPYPPARGYGTDIASSLMGRAPCEGNVTAFLINVLIALFSENF